MFDSENTISVLREALRISPDNVPLRRHLATTLMQTGRPGEAEQELRQLLALDPVDTEIRLELAEAFEQQGKTGEALVIVETLAKEPNPPARAFLLQARLLLGEGDRVRAAMAYRRALEFDPSLTDDGLAARLGVNRHGSSPLSPISPNDGAKRVPVPMQDRFDPVSPPVERPTVTFAEVGGMERVKEEIRLKIVHPLTYPELYRAYGKPIGGGILMYGPPGCGKTHLARATAGEIRANFIPVSISDVLDMWTGNSEKNLHALFEEARRTSPCVLFFDEVDALAARRSDMRYSTGRLTINQFLAEMDGMQYSNEGVLVLGATNAPWHLDPAFRRPGRFDRIIFVPPPDVAARASILRVQLRGKPQERVDFDHLARKSDGFSGADLKAVVDVAIEDKLAESIQTGVPTPLTTRDLAEAITTLRPTTTEWFATARNHALFSNEGGAYDDVLAYIKNNRM